MSLSKKIVLAVPTETELIKNLTKAQNWIDLKNQEVVLVHFFPISHYMNEFTPYAFPDDSQKVEIKASICKMLENVRDTLNLSKEKTTLICEFTNSVRPDMVDFLKNQGANLLILATRGKHGIPGLFDSSFAEYMNKYSPCDVLVLRPC